MFALLACVQNDYAVDKFEGGSGDTELEPDIEIEPDALAFPTSELGVVLGESVTIANVGQADLQITNMLVEGTGAFTLLTNDVGPVVAPGESIEAIVQFSPVNAEDFGTLWVYSDDPDSSLLGVELTGGALVPELRVAPNPYDFGAVLVGCSSSADFELSNVGLAPLTVKSIVGASAGYAVDAPDTPLVLEPGASTRASVTFTPGGEGAYPGELWVTSDDLVGLTVASHTGNGTLDGSVTEDFWQGDGPWEYSDIFFYVDQSGSMADDRENLTANFELLTSLLAGLDVDWQIVVATKDSGCSEHGVLIPSTPDVAQAFLDGVEGSSGRFTEAGLSVAANGMRNTTAGECNEGFVRDDSKTMIVLISDEPEQSPGSWSSYVSDILTYAPTASITAIAGDVPYGCATADPGTGYYEAAAATGGAFLSICASDWGAYFETIATLAATGRVDTFFLDSRPDPSSIVVTVDGVESSDWTYDGGANSVIFAEAAVPEAGAHVQVSFSLDGDCSG